MSLTMDITGLTKPRTVASVVKQAGLYLAHMRAAGKHVDHVDIRASDYDSILRAANAGRGKDQEKFGALRMGSIAVRRAA